MHYFQHPVNFVPANNRSPKVSSLTFSALADVMSILLVQKCMLVTVFEYAHVPWRCEA